MPGGPKRRRELVEADMKRAMELRQRGMTAEQIAKAMNKKRRTVSEWLKKIDPVHENPRPTKAEIAASNPSEIAAAPITCAERCALRSE